MIHKRTRRVAVSEPLEVRQLLAASIGVTTLTNGSNSDTPPGIHLRAAIDQVTWTYQVTNPGSEALTGIVVKDNNGTPANTSDDFTVGTIPTLAVGASTTLTHVGGVAAVGQYTNIGTATATGSVSGQTVSATNADNYFGDAPQLQLVTLTNGTNNDTAPGQHLRAGGPGVTWTYQVTNTGNVTMGNITVADDNGTPGNTSDDFTVGTVTSLAAGASASLTRAGGTAVAGQYTNVGSARGTDNFTNQTTTATNPDNYFGDSPSISITTLTNGTDNNSAPGVHLKAGIDSVTWTYQVSNTGNVALTNVVIKDNHGTPGTTSDDFTVGTVPTLAAGASTTLTYPGGLAMSGQYTNSGSVSGTDGFIGVTVSATSPDNYFGDLPSVSIVKSTNGVNNDSAPGIHLQAGVDNVTWTYQVSNTGNVTLSNVTVRDDNGTPADSSDDFTVGAVTSLAVGASTSLTKSGGVANPGQYTNVGTATAQDGFTGATVSAANPDNYFGDTPSYFSASPDTRFTLTGAAGAQTLTITSGTVTFTADAAATSPNLIVNVDPSTVIFNAAQHLGALNIDTDSKASLTAGGSTTLVINSLSIMGTGLLDLSDNALILNYSTTPPLDTIRPYLTKGRNAAPASAAPWNGPGIQSTYANQFGNGFNLAIGYADNVDLAAVRASGSYTSFAGQTVASNCILVQLTRGADATLDQTVDGQDVAIIGTKFQKPGSGQWCFGDFDYSGTCDGSDVAVLGTTFGKTSPVLSPAQFLTPIIQPASLVQTASPAVATDTSDKLFSSMAIPWNSASQDHRHNRPRHSLSAMDRINKPGLI